MYLAHELVLGLFAIRSALGLPLSFSAWQRIRPLLADVTAPVLAVRSVYSSVVCSANLAHCGSGFFRGSGPWLR